MADTYTGVLRGNRIDWDNGSPIEPSVRVLVTVLPEPPIALDRGRLMAAALERIAAIAPASSIADPEEWQREQRGERPLPGRDD